jgi:uncharacterized membrane protein YbhN (UPF0104 family)
MIGLFFNQFLPGSVGGDAMRLYFAFKLAPQRKIGATLSIAMDCLFGLLTVLFLAGLSSSLRFSWLTGSRTSRHIAYLVIILLRASLAFVVLLFWSSGLLPRLPKATPFRKAIIESGEALLRYRTHLVAMALAFPITVVAHLAYYTTFYCGGEALHASTPKAFGASLVDILAIMPLVDTIISVPISLGGIGVRETLFQALLGNLAHVPPALAAFTASLGFAIQASWGLLGAVVFLLSQKIISR